MYIKMLSLIIFITLLITSCDKNKDVIGMNEVDKDLWTEIAHFGDDIPTKLAISEDGYIFVGGSDIYRSKTDASFNMPSCLLRRICGNMVYNSMVNLKKLLNNVAINRKYFE